MSPDVPLPPTWNSRRLTGQVLQQTYRVESRIGTGSMGSVYDVVHLRFGRHFAAKVLSPLVSKNERALARFRQEALVTSSLGNPHILRIFDFNTMEDGTPYIIMELLRGEDLAERLERVKRLPLTLVTHLFQQAASALHDAHKKGIIHRDLKPQNIFLCRDEDGEDYIKVVDFGISKVLGARDAVTGTHELLGSPAFMSPEQAMVKASDVDLTADVFAMGAILYMMLSGRPPFWAESVPSVLYNIVHEPPPKLTSINPDVPATVEAVIERAMSKAREDRYQSMEDFWLEFARAAEVGDATADSPRQQPKWIEAPTTVDPRRGRDRPGEEMITLDEGPPDAGQGAPVVLAPEPALDTTLDEQEPAMEDTPAPPPALDFSPGPERDASGQLQYDPAFYQQDTLHIRQAPAFHEAATMIQRVAIDENPTAEVRSTIPPPPLAYQAEGKGSASGWLKLALVAACCLTMAMIAAVIVLFLR